MGPIALYPDALIALILPASTEPAEIVLATRYLATKPPADSIDRQPWSESVRGLARYPDVLAWMDTNLAWTRQVGDAFLAQPADVMNAVQHLRARARAIGTLTDTPEQRVVVEEQIIRIEPARIDVLYVPRYDPAIVYVSRPLGLRGSYISFSYGYPTGIWLAYTCDWHHRRVLVINHSHRVHYHNRPFYPVYSHHKPHPDYHRWTPRPGYQRPTVHHHSRTDIARPAPIVGTPPRRTSDVRISRPENIRPERVPTTTRVPTTRVQSDDRENRKRPAEVRRVAPVKRDPPPPAPLVTSPVPEKPSAPVLVRPAQPRPQRQPEPAIRPAPQRENRWPARSKSERTSIEQPTDEEKPVRRSRS